MVTLWIGDFRLKQLQNLFKGTASASDYYFLTEDLADCAWLENNINSQLPTLNLESANIVIALGFNDCAYSCAYDSLDISQKAKQYAEIINDLVKDYSNFKIYTCSVLPVDADYPFLSSSTQTITKTHLTAKIELFNKTLKNNCDAEYIDLYSYLVDTSFETRDGVRYTSNTLNTIHNFIRNKLSNNTTASFLARTTAPDPEVDSYIYWVHGDETWENPYTMPSSAAYAWGRFYEITGDTPKLSKADIEYWYSNASDGYVRGDTPKVGAIMCWQNGAIGGTDSGYAAIVEQVKEDGNIITSEIDANGTWQLVDRTKGAGNWGMTGTYHFQGFIYSPFTGNVSKNEICTENSYNISLDEMKLNARYIYAYLSSKGWSLNAAAGLLGNLQQESKMSPAIWESLIEGSTLKDDGSYELNMSAINSYYSSKGRYPGYGLVQWTPYSKYTDWCETNDLDYWDIDSQLQRINWEAENKRQWIAKPNKGYDLTFDEFINSTKSAAWLAEAFAFCYERPARSTGTISEQNALRSERGANGEFWYNYLSTLPLDTANNKSKILNFKIDKLLATEASISFILNNYTNIKCSLLKENTLIKRETFSSVDSFKVFTFKGLVPATSYKVIVEVMDSMKNVITRELSFTTSQDYPEDASKIQFYTTDYKSPDSRFTLQIAKPSYLGYWKNKSGYDIQLIVNNKPFKTITVNNASQNYSKVDFSLYDIFGYSGTNGDSIQLGVRIWVKDTNGNKLYSNEKAKTSEPICLLNKPIQLYIKK